MPSKKVSTTVRFLLWVLLPLILFSLLTRGIYAIYRSSQESIEELMFERNSYRAEQILNRLNLVFTERLKDISHLTEVIRDDDPSLALRRFLEDASGMMKRDTVYESIGFFDFSGTLRLSIPDRKTYLDLLTPEQIQDALEDTVALFSFTHEGVGKRYNAGILLPVPAGGALGPGVIVSMLCLDELIVSSIETFSLDPEDVAIVVDHIRITPSITPKKSNEREKVCSATVRGMILGSNWSVTVDRPLTPSLEHLTERNRNNYILSLITMFFAAALFFYSIALSAKRKVSEKRLKLSEERYRRLTENARDIIFRYSFVEKRFEYVSPATFSLTGYSSREFYRSPLTAKKLIAPEWKNYSKDHWRRLSRGIAEPLYEFRIIGKSGQSRWLQLRIVLICRNKTGDPEAAEGTAADITELRTALEERSQLIRELENKNAELERFAYTISHELKAPLITIRGFLGYLEKEALEGDTASLYKDISLIRVATETMRKLLDGLIELSRVGRRSEESEDIPFTELTQQAASHFKTALKEKNVSLHIAPDMPVVHGNRTELQELIENLFENSLKFLGDQPKPEITINSFKKDSQTIFRVKDNGIGIEQKYQERIFRIFNKLDPGTEGAGVGLALAKRIVSSHGGWITLQSEGSGKGTTVLFTLPVKQ